jgi:hypothetical protein
MIHFPPNGMAMRQTSGSARTTAIDGDLLQALGGAITAAVCHAKSMANKQAKSSRLKTTEWRIGQPLDSPQVHSGPLRETVNQPMRDQFGSKRQKHKKK